jgi:hypothetical protein
LHIYFKPVGNFRRSFTSLRAVNSGLPVILPLPKAWTVKGNAVF